MGAKLCNYNAEILATGTPEAVGKMVGRFAEPSNIKSVPFVETGLSIREDTEKLKKSISNGLRKREALRKTCRNYKQVGKRRMKKCGALKVGWTS